MTLQVKFTEKYGISPLKLVEDTNYEYLGFIKKNNLTSALERYIEEKKLNIEVNSEFEKGLVEAFAEAGERFPESGKIAGLEKGVLLSIPKVNAGVPKSKGTLENFKEVVGTDSLRPVMSGIFVSEDGGSLVGTDAHKLVVQKTNEFSEYAGKIIDFNVYTQTKGKKITFVDGKYPNYEAVIPKDNPNEIKNFDTYALYNAAKSSIAVHKMVDQILFNINLKLPTVNGDGTMIASFNPVFVADVTTFALVNGWSKFTLEYSSETRAYILNFGGGNIGLIMPIMNSYGENAGLHGGEVMTPEEIMDKYKFAGKMKSVKPAAPKPARPSAPASSEPFKKFEGNIGDTNYISRREIASITLTNGEVLGGNDIIDGIYRVNKKMAHGGGIDQDEPYSKNLYSFVDWEKIKIFLEKTYTPSQTDIIMRSSWMRKIGRKENFKNFVLFFNEYKRYLDQMLEEEGDYAHGGSMYAGGGNLGKTGSKTYKLRAEGLNDFLAFLQNDMYFKIKSFTIEPIGVPDVVVTFETSSSLSEIKQKLEEVPDSHVMLETVKPINEYTGERERANRKYAHGGSMYADGGSTPNGKDFLLSKGYDFDGEVYFESDGEVIEVVQGSKGTSKQIGIYFHTNEPISISRSMLDKISSSFGKSFHIKLFTNAGVDLRSSENGKFKNISVERIKYAHGGSMYADKIPSRPFLVEIKPLFKGEEPLVVRVSPDTVGEFTAGYTIYSDAKSTKKVGYVTKLEMEGKIENGEYKILSDSNKFAHGGSMYADGGKIKPNDSDSYYRWRVKKFGFKPYGKEKGRFKITYIAEGEPQQEIHTTKEMAIDTANRYKKIYEDVKIFDESDSEIKYAHGGSMYAGGGEIKVGDKVIWRGNEYTFSKITNNSVAGMIDEKYHLHSYKKNVSDAILDSLKDVKKMAHGGSMSSSHEVGDTVTFNSVMGGMKTGEILSTLGADGYRIKTEDGFAMVKKSAIV